VQIIARRGHLQNCNVAIATRFIIVGRPSYFYRVFPSWLTSLKHVVFYATGKGWSEMNQFYVYNKEFITYVLPTMGKSWRWPPAFATRCVKRCTELSKTGQLLTCGRKFIPKNTLRLLYCEWPIFV